MQYNDLLVSGVLVDCVVCFLVCSTTHLLHSARRARRLRNLRLIAPVAAHHELRVRVTELPGDHRIRDPRRPGGRGLATPDVTPRRH